MVGCTCDHGSSFCLVLDGEASDWFFFYLSSFVGMWYSSLFWVFCAVSFRDAYIFYAWSPAVEAAARAGFVTYIFLASFAFVTFFFGIVAAIPLDSEIFILICNKFWWKSCLMLYSSTSQHVYGVVGLDLCIFCNLVGLIVCRMSLKFLSSLLYWLEQSQVLS